MHDQRLEKRGVGRSVCVSAERPPRNSEDDETAKMVFRRVVRPLLCAENGSIRLNPEDLKAHSFVAYPVIFDSTYGS